MELDAGLELLFSLLVTLEEIVECCELNLLFSRKSLSSPLNEVDDNLDNEVETLDKHKVNLVGSDEERSGLK